MAGVADILEDLSVSSITPVKGSVKDAFELTPRQRKSIKKATTPVKHNSNWGGSRRYLHKREAASDLLGGVDPEIFFRLGVAIVDPPKNSTARKDLVTKLVAAVREDLQIISQETMEAQLREQGFWRWAGKTAWHNIMAVRQTLDWATGQKIDPLAHRPTYDINNPPTFDDEGLETSFPGLEFDEHAVKPPTDRSSSLLEDSESISSDELTSACPSSLPRIIEESIVDQEFQVVTKKGKNKGKKKQTVAPTPRATKNLSARKSLAKSQRLADIKDDEVYDDADFTPEAMASKFTSSGSRGDTLEYTNAFYRGAKHHIVNPRR